MSLDNRGLGTSDATPSSLATHGSTDKQSLTKVALFRTFELHCAFDVRGNKSYSKRDVTDNIKEPRIHHESHPSAYPTDFENHPCTTPPPERVHLLSLEFSFGTSGGLDCSRRIRARFHATQSPGRSSGNPGR